MYVKANGAGLSSRRATDKLEVNKARRGRIRTPREMAEIRLEDVSSRIPSSESI
jgi:hypothetical protein